MHEGREIEFDPATGRLRLTAAEFEQLVHHSAPGSSHPADLVAAGALTDDGPHPLLAAGLAAVRTPLCRILVQVVGDAGSHLHQGWVSLQAAAFLLRVREDRYDFLTTGPDFTPAAIARVLRLGPRGVPPGPPLSSPTSLLEALFADDRSTRREAIAELTEQEESDAASERRWQASRVVVGWTGPDGDPAGRDLTMVRTARGTRVTEFPDPAADVVLWAPVTSSELWRAIVGLLPDDAEVAAPVA